MEEESVANGTTMVNVPSHPLIKHWISVLRNEQTPCATFKNAMAELGRLLIYEASRDWLIVPILRAGLALAEHASSVLPATRTYHLGENKCIKHHYIYNRFFTMAKCCMRRDEMTLEPSLYLNKLPDKFQEGSHILLIDPMLATGVLLFNDRNLCTGSKDAHDIVNKYVTGIRGCVQMPGISAKENCPKTFRYEAKNRKRLHVYTGIVDPVLNEKGYLFFFYPLYA
ncbi:hypothetical protein BHM03_00003093 [Ensete ventricosum]|nr:hypothetical protein BHM03_00003093 [Ensete ventricosum]